MDRPDELHTRMQELEERLAGLSQASLRINESLDFDTVLQGALDSARSLTGASYGVMTVLDEGGQVRDWLSSGMSAEEAAELWQTPERWAIFERLGSISEPLRLPDLVGHVRALGFAEFRLPLPVEQATPFLASQMLSGSQRVGNIFLAGRENGREFAPADEQTLFMFASQAALVIANARQHREERRARADLETLIDTSPVGVVVFDAPTGALKSINREARRIADKLRDHDQTPEMLLEVIVCERADGSELSLRELPLAELLSVGETLRAEEIVLRAPDGRSVMVLLNATPILSDEGAVESMVVAMQDMATVAEQERLRADFLAMVSHELRAPLATIKGSSSTALGSATDLDPAVMRQFFRIIEDQADQMNNLVSDLLDVARIETGSLAVSPEPAEVGVMVDRARGAFISAGGGNPLTIDVEPELPLVRADRRRIVQVLLNLLSNAARHSSELSAITVGAEREGVHVSISVADQGRGIPSENLPLLFRKFSRSQFEEQGGDTGLGLAICKGIVEAHGGRIWAESDGPGLGARFTFTLPVDGADAASGLAPASTRSRRRRKRRGAAGNGVRVLAVDDDPQSLRYVRDALIRSGYAPLLTGDPEEALRLMEDEQPQLALLDLMLPEIDGIELMMKILEIAKVPVIFLSAYGQDETIARAFKKGAVDYMVKPFSPTELTARIGSALRRREVSEPSEPYVLGDLTIDYSARSVTLADRPVQLTAMEYRMLTELSANDGRVSAYEYLFERIWGEKAGDDMSPMRTIVGKLRRKLGDDGDNPTYIFTETRIGYRMPKGEKPSGESR